MSGRIPKEFISELLMRVDIVDVINSHVPLKKSGANYVARCPFHLEKTPSFSVSRKKQFFHCFGCGASGNVIGFLMDFNRLDFVEAVEDLALFAGLPVPKEEGQGYRANLPKLNELQALLASVAEYYIEQLRVQQAGKQAVAYLKKRGINSQYATEYKLGYAPFEWQELTEKFNQDLLLMAGVLGVNDDDNRVYGRFRHRVMFPIRSKRGNVIGFGGRVLDDSMPKYLNSPETVLFHKSQEVYGLYELLARNAKPLRILVVEGYMDVIALAQFGVGYAVAALGTALTEQHINLLFRFSAEIVLCFDGDKAGRMAAWKAMDAVFPCLKDDRQVKVMLLPLEHDPDSIIRVEGVNAFVLRVEQATVLSDYFFAQLSEHLDLATVEGCSQLTLKAEPYLQKMPDGLLKDMMFQRLGQLANFKVARKKLTVKNLNKKKRISCSRIGQAFS
ncbi:DNA primase [Methylocucumis oryzae]|uniref:DNA primase n=1 Tax=Methylocucumis oryzae TaxID=1632867 RepID=UPI000A749EEE|nr:DNA primase [Methylocucumis oryzae]